MACVVNKQDVLDEIHKNFVTRNDVDSNENGYWYPFSLNNRALPKDLINILTQQEAKFGNGRYGDLITLEQNEFGIQININPSKELTDALTKQNLEDDARDRENYERDNFLDSDMLFSNTPSVNSPMDTVNLNFYIQSKQGFKQKIERRIADLKTARKFKNDKSIRQELSRMLALEERITGELNELLQSPDLFEMSLSMFNSDLDLIRSLLTGSSPSVEDIHSAEYLISFFDVISNYSPSNVKNKLVDVKNSQNLAPEIKGPLDKLRGELTDLHSKLYTAKTSYLMDLIENTPKIKRLYPDMETEAILAKILEDRDDIGLVTQLFGTIDKSFGNKDSLLGQLTRRELEMNRSKNKSYSADLITRLDKLLPAVNKKLLQMGKGFSRKSFTALTGSINYDMFYQKDQHGNKTGNLIGKWSKKWFVDQSRFLTANRASFDEAIMDGDWDAMNTSLTNKYEWLNENTNFFNLNMIPEITDNPEFRNFGQHFRGTTKERQDYRQDVINQIGQDLYDKLVEEQIDYIRDYIDMGRQEIQMLLESHGVQKTSELPPEVQNTMNITLLRNSPFDFMNNHLDGHKSNIAYTIGTQTNTYPSHLKYNSYFPKSSKEVVNFNTGKTNTIDTGYIDESFSEIENDTDFREFWKILNEMAVYMNMTLSDGAMRLTPNSLPYIQKMALETLLDKNIGWKPTTTTLLNSTVEWLGKVFTDKLSKPDANEVDTISKANMTNVKSQANKLYDTEILRLRNLMNADVVGATMLTTDSLQPDVLNYFLDLTGSESILQLQDTIGKTFKVGEVLRVYLTDQVMNDMSFNLPVIMKAYMDMVSEYKSQLDSQPKLTVYKDLYNSIKTKQKSQTQDPTSDVLLAIKDNIKSKGIENKRVKANLRYNTWYTRNILNTSEDETWANLSNLIGKKAYTKQESEFKKMLLLEKDRVKEKMSNESDPDKIDKLTYELLELQDSIDNLGRDFTLASMYNAIANKFVVFKGLAWNVPASVTNRVQGLYAGLVNDTGRFWKEGNFYEANNFIMKKGLRYLPGYTKYKEEIKKTRLLMEKLDIIQDATNELDKARNIKGFTGMVKKLNPYYLTEYVEWHNQTPQILSMLMDETIKNQVTGEMVQIFDGNSLPAHEINADGDLVLKPEFRTPESIETWENFSNDEFAEKKVKMNDVITIINGDYSRTGSTYIKSTSFGRSVMTFKTWLPNQLYQRFAFEQESLAQDDDRFNGYYTGAFLNKNTSVATSLAATLGVATIGVMGLGLGAGALISGSFFIGSRLYYKNRSDNAPGTEEIKAATQLAAFAQGLLRKFIGMPVNLVTGKDLVKAYQYDELKLTEAERQQLSSVVAEISSLLTLTLMKVIWRSMMGDDEEDEPKTILGADGKRYPNPYYTEQQRKTESEKRMFNLIENQLTKTIGEISQYYNPIDLMKTMTGIGLEKSLNDVMNIGYSMTSWAVGQDEIQSGPNAGESRMMNQLQKTFVPSLFRSGFGGMGTLGFENMMEREWNANEFVDRIFDTDMKSDKKIERSRRSSLRRELTKKLKKDYGYDKETPQDQLYLDEVIAKKVEEEVRVIEAYTPRGQYDAKQMRVKK